ncbi:MAG: hypothetical protein KGM43_15830, partial [Planctomycetota bacterium]|nr:hypothetical protein [Planctomycetota bacterium]
LDEGDAVGSLAKLPEEELSANLEDVPDAEAIEDDGPPPRSETEVEQPELDERGDGEVDETD